MVVGVYVNDLLVGGSETDCMVLLAYLNKCFPTKNLVESTCYDGCGIGRDIALGTVNLSPEAYVESTVTRLEVEPTSDIPPSPSDDLEPKRGDEPGGDRPVAYFLLWLSTMTRSDITNAVRAKAVRAVVRYAHTHREAWELN